VERASSDEGDQAGQTGGNEEQHRRERLTRGQQIDGDRDRARK
jgi:hypothetical protein